MARSVRRCRHCRRPLKATARSDAKFCSKACAQAERRWRRHFAVGVEVGFYLIEHGGDALAVPCPVCGRRFIPGHGHRRDAIYDRPACRQTAYRSRRLGEQPLREAVTAPADLTPARSRYTPLTSANPFHLVEAVSMGVQE
ncbi:hypothetical protein AB0D86_49070 [Streptomyces sp. NPDC048324]|uniref:hypothetical protein n=1 Tax=Streptomyces sp. NPDC048324 TaxID=3157205 RepID=UPI0034435BEF